MVGFGVLLLMIAGLSSFTVQSDRSTENQFRIVSRLKSNEVLDQRVEKRVFEGRMQVWMALATGDQDHWSKAAAAFRTAHERLRDLIAATTDPGRLAQANQMDRVLTGFEAKEAQLKELKGGNAALNTPEARQMLGEAASAAGQVDTVGEDLSVDYRHAADTSATDALGDIAEATTIAIVVGLASVLVGSILGFMVARSIAGPINAITQSMRVLAAGNLTAEIPGASRKDEVGAMAAAVAVFKDSMVEAAGLRVEQETAAQRTAAERRQAMLEMAQKFEAGVASVVTGVTAQANDLQATAQSMAATAQQTTQQSTTVAAASEQASQNVQTVASAAEELSACPGNYRAGNSIEPDDR